ncbi:protein DETOXIFICATION 41 [Ricinus communis]|uniref:Protein DETOXIFICATION n=1 Tax=Ricinus communis TaxID=3988 RepID=B9SYQ3_RICCO|nr:protein DETOXIFICATION 41 [Ricinus communis]EEF31256.1 multidrug resistance pump, putative [Ricinus communis]|eukprot:XP_002531122.1 protein DETOXIFICATION 41 [Ricinus communis]
MEPTLDQELIPGDESYASIIDLPSNEVEKILERRRLSFRMWVYLFAWESKILWTLSGSTIPVFLCNFMLSFVSILVAGHLGATELAGASVATIGIQGLTYGILLGMSCAVLTTCGQAYGAKQYAALGIICQRALILELAAAVLLTFLYIWSGDFLRAIGQSKPIAEQGQIFSHGLILQLYALAICFPLQRFLQAQNIVNPIAYLSVAVFLIHILLSWLVVYVLEFGLLGVSIVLGISWWLLVISLALYILLSPNCKETWTGFSLNAFRNMLPFFKFAAASGAMLCLELWYNQGIILLSGLLPNPTVSLDSMSIGMNYWNWDLTFLLGLSISVSIRVGNELGAGNPKVTKFAVIVVNVTSIIISIIFTVIVLSCRVGLSKLFTSDPEVIAAVLKLIPLLAVSVLLNGIQPILSGVAVGSGWQDTVAYVNIVAYYGIGLPIGCALGFKTKLGVSGIWIGLIIGVFCQTAVILFIAARTNWEAEVEKAAERLKVSGKEAMELVGNIEGGH